MYIDLKFNKLIFQKSELNPKNWTQKSGFLFNLHKHILSMPIVLIFDRG